MGRANPLRAVAATAAIIGGVVILQTVHAGPAVAAQSGPDEMPAAKREPQWHYQHEGALTVGFGFQFARYYARRSAEHNDGADLTESIRRMTDGLPLQVSNFARHFKQAKWRVYENGRTGLTVRYAGLPASGCQEASTADYLIRPGLDMLSQSLTLRAYERERVMRIENRDCDSGNLRVTYWTAYPGTASHTRFLPFLQANTQRK